jgi:hypothetical protein
MGQMLDHLTKLDRVKGPVTTSYRYDPRSIMWFRMVPFPDQLEQYFKVLYIVIGGIRPPVGC